MPAKRINPRLIKLHRIYSVEDLSRVLGAHKNSVRGWIKDGLATTDQRRPLLMLGHEIRAYLEARRKAARRPCSPGTLYCLKCRKPMPPALGMVDFVRDKATTGNLSALCETCGTPMHRRARLDALAAIMPDLEVKIREAAPRLVERTPPSLNCDNGKE